MLTALPLPQDKGRIVVNQQTEVPEWPGVWAIGDCAAIPQVDGQTSPPTAQHALRQAKTCAENIVASYRGTPKKIFGFTGLGKLGSLGRRSAVAEIFGFRLKGLIAWVLWRNVFSPRNFRAGRPDSPARRLVSRCVSSARHHPTAALSQARRCLASISRPAKRFFRRATFGDKVYFIVRGEVTVRHDGATLATLRAGAGVFWRAARLHQHRPRNATIRAASALSAVAVSREAAFKKLLGYLPGLSGAMQEVMSAPDGADLRVDLAWRNG